MRTPSFESAACISIALLCMYLFDQTVGQTCTQQGNCVCTFPDGKSIDLNPIANKDSTPRFNYQKEPNKDFQYAYNPCLPFSEVGADNPCVNVAACQRSVPKSGVETMYYNIGTQDTAKFSSDGTVITYTSTEGRTTNVRLICDKGVSASKSLYTVTGEGATNVYELSITSCQACSGGCSKSSKRLSFGSILCILFTVFVFVYLFGGILFNRYARGASGKEVIPNVSLWQEFPLLVKDGFVFVASGCGLKEGTGYESI